jgi:hypothetical protein
LFCTFFVLAKPFLFLYLSLLYKFVRCINDLLIFLCKNPIKIINWISSMQDREKALIEAIRAGNTEEVGKLLKEGVGIPAYLFGTDFKINPNFNIDSEKIEVKEGIRNILQGYLNILQARAPLPTDLPPPPDLPPIPPFIDSAQSLDLAPSGDELEDPPSPPNHSAPPIPISEASSPTQSDETFNKARKFVALMQFGGVNPRVSQNTVTYVPSRYSAWQEVEGFFEWNQLNESGELKTMGIKAVWAFRDSLNSLIGDRGRDSVEYRRFMSSIGALVTILDKEPLTDQDVKKIQARINLIQTQMGELYANNPNIQNHVSITDFMGLVTNASNKMLDSLNMNLGVLMYGQRTETGHGMLVSKPNHALLPILSAIGEDKIVRHDSATKNAQDCKYLMGIRGGWIERDLDENIAPMQNINKAIGNFGVVLDNFKLAKMINEHPDAVMRYLKDMQDKKLPINREMLEAVTIMLDTFTSRETRENMQRIVNQLDSTSYTDSPYRGIAASFMGFYQSMRRGIDSMIGRDNDIRDAFVEFKRLYEVYGSLFQQKDVIVNKVTRDFTDKVLRSSSAENPRIIDGCRGEIDKLVDDNGRGSREFGALITELDKLESMVNTISGRRIKTAEFEQLQNSLDNIAKATAALYANPSIQGNSSLKEFTEGMARGMIGLVDSVNKKLGLKGSMVLRSSAQDIMIRTLAQNPEQLRGYGSDTRKIEAHDYLLKLKKSWLEEGVSTNPKIIQSVDALIGHFNGRDNFKLAELINKDPERVVRALANMDRSLWPEVSEEGVAKITTVLDYLSSDKTKDNMGKIVEGLNRENPKGEAWTLKKVFEGFASIITAIARGVDIVSGFDSDLQEALRELRDITALSHDVIKEKVSARGEEQSSDKAKDFAEKVMAKRRVSAVEAVR